MVPSRPFGHRDMRSEESAGGTQRLDRRESGLFEKMPVGQEDRQLYGIFVVRPTLRYFGHGTVAAAKAAAVEGAVRYTAGTKCSVRSGACASRRFVCRSITLEALERKGAPGGLQASTLDTLTWEHCTSESPESRPQSNALHGFTPSLPAPSAPSAPPSPKEHGALALTSRGPCGSWLSISF